MPNSYDYAVIRVVPFVEREEFFNAGVILFCAEQKFLAARMHIDLKKLEALAPGLPVDELRERLDAVVKVCAGDPAAGPIARLPQRARFHWLVSPRSTLVQVSAVHAGICDEPASVLNRLFLEQVLNTPE
jgi:hypothetical protein